MKKIFPILKHYVIILPLLSTSYLLLGMDSGYPEDSTHFICTSHAENQRSINTTTIVTIPAPRYRNIIFDLGGVLLSGNATEFAQRAFNSRDVPYDIAQALKSDAWKDWDGGLINKRQLIEILSKTFDRAHIEKFIATFLDLKRPLIQEVVDILKRLKERGFKVYLLSNFSRDSYVFFYPVYRSLFDSFDGVLFSFQCNLIKPASEIYKLLLKTYNLLSEECLFIDDSAINIEGAQQAHIDGIVYKPGTLDEELHKRGI
jgi:HAD superfamily hydrolase (TIGR01509 family)